MQSCRRGLQRQHAYPVLCRHLFTGVTTENRAETARRRAGRTADEEAGGEEAGEAAAGGQSRVGGLHHGRAAGAGVSIKYKVLQLLLLSGARGILYRPNITVIDS